MQRMLTLALLCVCPLCYGQSPPWPAPFPCKISDGKSPNVMFMTLGTVSTPLSQGMFFPAGDSVVLSNGRVLQHYYRDTLGFTFYTPIDKSIRRDPIAGWSSWTWYRYAMNEDTIRHIADVMDTTLRPYGLGVIQIDDGWDANWNTWIPEILRFPHGMDSIVHYLHDRHFTAGLWIIPQLAQNRWEFPLYDAFIRDKNHNVVPTNIAFGQVDPTAPMGPWFIQKLMDSVLHWGFAYIKSDYQSRISLFYDSLSPLCAEPNKPGSYYFRKSLEAIRASIGKNVYWTASFECDYAWNGTGRGAPLTGIGYYDACRIEYDTRLEYQYFTDLYGGLMHYYFLNNVATYADPDGFCVGDTVDIEFGRMWATLLSLGGMPMMNVDCPERVNQDRMEILRRVYPPTNVRPMDLYPTFGKQKQIWDLKLSDQRRSYDVVGIIAVADPQEGPTTIDWSEMGWNPDDKYDVYDFWNKKYLGAWQGSMTVIVPARSCRLFSFIRSASVPQLLSTNRHITQGWLEIDSLRYDSTKNEFRGVSEVVRRDTYELRFVVPHNNHLVYTVSTVSVDALPATFTQDGSFVTMRFVSPVSRAVSWRIGFVAKTLADVQSASMIPSFALDAVFPNPVRDNRRTGTESGRIRFTSSAEMPLDLSICDILGRQIATLFHGNATRTTYEALIPESVRVPGTYFAVLTGDQTSVVKPFIISR